jgi:hypothetical protein
MLNENNTVCVCMVVCVYFVLMCKRKKDREKVQWCEIFPFIVFYVPFQQSEKERKSESNNFEMIYLEGVRLEDLSQFV